MVLFLEIFFETHLFSLLVLIIAKCVSQRSLLGFVVGIVLGVSDFLQSLDNFVTSCILGHRTDPVGYASVYEESLHYKHQFRPEDSHFAVKLPIYLLQGILQPTYFFVQCCSFLLKKFPQLFIRMR